MACILRKQRFNNSTSEWILMHPYAHILCKSDLCDLIIKYLSYIFNSISVVKYIHTNTLNNKFLWIIITTFMHSLTPRTIDWLIVYTFLTRVPHNHTDNRIMSEQQLNLPLSFQEENIFKKPVVTSFFFKCYF